VTPRLFLAASFALLLAGCASDTIIATHAVTLSCTYVKSTTIESSAGGLEVEVPTLITVTKTATSSEDAAALIRKETQGKPCTQVNVGTSGVAASQ
jgi:hypothetical protein